jgi:ketosteroid isomerase-like protein
VTGADESLVRSVYETWNAEGPDAIGSRLADSVVLEDAPELPDAGTWKGRQAVLGRLREVAETIGGGWVEVQRIQSAGGEVVVSMVWHEAEGRATPAFGEVFHLVRVEGGQIVSMRVFLSETAALAAAAS